MVKLSEPKSKDKLMNFIFLKNILSISVISLLFINSSIGDMKRISFKAQNGDLRDYVVFEPENYDSSKPWPIILFLHGAGERGEDGWKPTQVGIGKILKSNPQLYPALVIMPQLRENEGWCLSNVYVSYVTYRVNCHIMPY